MTDDEARRSAHLADSPANPSGRHAGQLESDAAVRNGDIAESLALDAASTPDGERPDVAPAAETTSVAEPVTATETTDNPPDAETKADDGGGGTGTGPPPSRWQFWRRGDRPKKHKKAPWWELPVLIAVAIAVAVVIKTFLVQPFYIPSESMEKTLHGCPGCSGDRVLVNKLILDIRDPHPGDIVVFRAPANWDEEPTPKSPSNPIVKGVRWFGQLIGFVPPDEKDLIKRVIAVGGQTVQCCDAQGRVQVSTTGPNGPWHSLDEPYIYQDSPWDPRNKPGHIVSSGGDQRTFGPVTIPKGRLWVMGDHRGDSADSKYHCIEESPADHVCETTNTTVAVNKVIGKAALIAWPPSRWRTLGTPPTFKHLADAAMPALGSAFLVLPIFGLRRRRRRL
ncbi:MAG TPA: signal peptidase I [Jatrophihabitantaceae bacterium]|nr:signal peptidase I [Jatrophihabitantaceae bacterium]